MPRTQNGNAYAGRACPLSSSPKEWVSINRVNFGVSGPKFTCFLLFNEGWIVVDNAVYRLSIFLFVFLDICGQILK